MPSKKLQCEDYSVAWICALPLEMKAAKAMLDLTHEAVSTSDDNSYTVGEIHGHNVVIACLPMGVYGTNAASALVAQLKLAFPSIQFGLLVGVGGGAPREENDIRLGDIVVSKPIGDHGGVIQYDHGKVLAGGTFQRTGILNKPPMRLLKALSKLDSQDQQIQERISMTISQAFGNNPNMQDYFEIPTEDLLFESTYDHDAAKATCDGCDRNKLVNRRTRSLSGPRVHYGTIASGNQVIKDGEKRRILAKAGGILCFEMEAAGIMDQLPSLVVRGICDYSDSHKQKGWQPYAAATAAAFAKELLSVVEPYYSRQVWRLEQLQSVSSDMDFIIQNNLLPYVNQAAFDGQNAHNVCLEKTRVALISQIMDWATAAPGAHHRDVFMLSGNAGTGKSTLLKTIAQRLKDHGNLGGSFFFNRSDNECDRLDFVFTTLANHLICNQPTVRPGVIQAVKKNHLIKGAASESQWAQLIIGPTEYLSQDGLPLVLVIDALDECTGGGNGGDSSNENRKHIDELLLLLARLSKQGNRRLRILISSRPEGFRFHSIPVEYMQEVDLHNAESREEDVAYYLQTRLSEIRERYCPKNYGWPDLKEIKAVQERAGALFIYAAIACRLIGEDELEYDHRLSAIAKKDNSGVEGLFDIYRQILFSASHNVRSKHEMQFSVALTDIIATILVLFSPLSAQQIDLFLQYDPPAFPVQRCIPFISSILISTRRDSPLQIYHNSFRDFFMHPDRNGEKFWVSTSMAHEYVLSHCLRVFAKSLHSDMCQLKSPGYIISDLDQKVVNAYLPPHVQYACRFWTHHLIETGIYTCYKRLMDFFQLHFLYWVECMSLMQQLDEATQMVSAVRHALADELQYHPSLAALVSDANFFLMSSSPTIKRAPLQVYHSAIAFAPTESLIRKHYLDSKEALHSLASRVTILPTRDYWDPSVQRCKYKFITDHCMFTTHLAFSSDGRLLASASDNNTTVQVWNMKSGLCIRVRQSDRLRMTKAIAFVNNELLASLDYGDNFIRLWDLNLDSTVELKGHARPINGMSCSRDGLLVTVSDDGTAMIWEPCGGEYRVHSYKMGDNIGTNNESQNESGGEMESKDRVTKVNIDCANTSEGTQLRDLEEQNKTYKSHGEYHQLSVAISPSSRYLAAEKKSTAVLIWDLNTKSLETSYKLPNDKRLIELLFSANETTLALNFDCGTIMLWDFKTKDTLYEYQRQLSISRFKRKIAFSLDGLLFGHTQPTTVLDLKSGALHHPTFGNINSTLTFYGNDRIVIGEASGNVAIYYPKSSLTADILTSHSEGILELAVSDTGLLASASSDRTIRVWDLEAAPRQAQPLHHQQGVRFLDFTPYGDLISSCSSETCVWDPQTLELKNRMLCLFCRISPKGFLILVWHNAIAIWDTMTRAYRNHFEVHPGQPKVISFAKDILAVGTSRGLLYVWDIVRGQLLHRLQGEASEIESIAIYEDRYVACGHASTDILVWDLALENFTRVRRSHTHRIWALAFSEHGHLASSSWNGDTYLHLRGSWKVSKHLKGERKLFPPLKAMDFYEGKLISRLELVNGVDIWDLETGELQILKDEELSDSLLVALNRQCLSYSPDWASYTLHNRAGNGWIKFKNRKILYINEDSKIVKCATRENMVAFGFRDGRVMVMHIDDKA